MSDIYEQLGKNKKKKVATRSHDGFTNHNRLGEDPSTNSPEKLETSELKTLKTTNTDKSDDGLVPREVKVPIKDDDLVNTAKPKSIALEVNVKQQLDEFLFNNKQVSWDTFIEASVTHALNSTEREKIIEDAADRLSQRKLSSTIRRINTMYQNHK